MLQKKERNHIANKSHSSIKEKKYCTASLETITVEGVYSRLTRQRRIERTALEHSIQKTSSEGMSPTSTAAVVLAAQWQRVKPKSSCVTQICMKCLFAYLPLISYAFSSPSCPPPSGFPAGMLLGSTWRPI